MTHRSQFGPPGLYQPPCQYPSVQSEVHSIVLYNERIQPICMRYIKDTSRKSFPSVIVRSVSRSWNRSSRTMSTPSFMDRFTISMIAFFDWPRFFIMRFKNSRSLLYSLASKESLTYDCLKKDRTISQAIWINFRLSASCRACFSSIKSWLIRCKYGVQASPSPISIIFSTCCIFIILIPY